MLSDQDKKELEQKIRSNTHELYVISFEEMDAIIRSSPKGNKPNIKADWQRIKRKAEVGANHYSSASSVGTVTKLVGDLGGIGARAYIKNYRGKPHIILKGHPGLRTVLTGTKYGLKNPKVIEMGLGRVGAVDAAKRGGFVTIILLSAYRVVDHFLTDTATLNQLIGTLATDVVKVGIATGAGILVASSTVVGTFAIGPIVAVVIVGLGVSMLLDYADNRSGVTERIITGLDQLVDDTERYFAEKKQQTLDTAGRAVHEVIDHTVKSARAIAVSWARLTLREYLSLTPRVK